MKKLLLKFGSVCLVCIYTLFSLTSCAWLSIVVHTHSFQSKANEISHYKECECGEIIDNTNHIFNWIVDTEPTYTASGYKHKECSACGYKTAENTIIDRLLFETVINNLSIKNNASVYSTFSFNSQNQLLDFFENNRNKISSKFLCVNAVSDPEEKIHIVLENYKVSYVFSYDDEGALPGAENIPDEYSNPCISISYELYSEELGSSIDLGDKDGYLCSIAFLMLFSEITDEEISLTFEFYNYDNGAMQNIIRVMNNGKCVGEILYNTEELYVSREWIVDYLTRNITIIE